MLKNDYIDRLSTRLAICELHLKRMIFAQKRISNLFPLTVDSYRAMKEEQISFADQLIYRFSKLQDTMGNKLFPLMLEGLQEDVETLPFIDILSKIEKLGLIESSNQWLTLREIRNVVTHEYPFQLDQLIEGLNQINEQIEMLIKIWNTLKNYSKQRFGI